MLFTYTNFINKFELFKDKENNIKIVAKSEIIIEP